MIHFRLMILVVTLKVFTDLCKHFPYNPLIVYININSLKEKVISLKVLLLNTPTGIPCTDVSM